MCFVRGGVCWCVCGVVYVLRVCVGCAFCDLVLRCAVRCDVRSGVGAQCVVCGVCSVCCLCVARLGTREKPRV